MRSSKHSKQFVRIIWDSSVWTTVQKKHVPTQLWECPLTFPTAHQNRPGAQPSSSLPSPQAHIAVGGKPRCVVWWYFPDGYLITVILKTGYWETEGKYVPCNSEVLRGTRKTGWDSAQKHAESKLKRHSYLLNTKMHAKDRMLTGKPWEWDTVEM